MDRLLVLAPGALLTFSDTLQLFGIVVLLVGGLAIGRVRRKDATIVDLEAAVRAQSARIEATELELQGAQERADTEHDQRRACEQQVARLQGELATMERYTAQGALESVAERLATLENTIVTAISSQGELVMKNTEILSRLDQHGEKHLEVLDRMLVRLEELRA